VDKRKLAEVPAWPQPQTGNQIEKYLGLVNFFRDVVPMYAKIAAPLERLRKIPVLQQHHWTVECKEAFVMLKDVIEAGMFLHNPYFEKQFRVAVDASTGGVAAVLYQLADISRADTARNRRYVLFVARALHVSERSYMPTKLELLGIVFALKKLHYYIYGVHFLLFTDHGALTHLMTQKHLNHLLESWFEVIYLYNFTPVHRPGIENILPDTLSRLFATRRERKLIRETRAAQRSFTSSASAEPSK
jgi:hypothetical protein